jgi:RimJ/RimL family protein N-acetyltransferase
MENGMDQRFRRGLRYYFHRAGAIVRQDGWPALRKRLVETASPSLRQTHLLVMKMWYLEESSRQSTDSSRRRNRAARMMRMTADLEIRQISEEEDPDLDMVAAVDEWHTRRPLLVQRLRHGERCSIAKRNGKIIAAAWLTTSSVFHETYFKRDFELGTCESYLWGAHCVPSQRGTGVMSRLIDSALQEMVTNHGKCEFVILVRPSNRPSIGTSEKIGFRRVGRTGFIEFFGFRLHYVFGRNAFEYTRRRLFLERIK